MFKRSMLSMFVALALLVSVGCSSTGFMPIQDAPRGASASQTLGMRHVVDTGALSPTERYSWLEVCDKVEVPSFILFTSTKYINCDPNVPLTQAAQKTSTTGWVAGVVGPVIQTGMVAASVAYAGHEIGQGISKSGSRTTNNNTTNSNGGTQSQGQLQGQGQSQGQAAFGGSGGNGGNGGAGGIGGTTSSCHGNCK